MPSTLKVLPSWGFLFKHGVEYDCEDDRVANHRGLILALVSAFLGLYVAPDLSYLPSSWYIVRFACVMHAGFGVHRISTDTWRRGPLPWPTTRVVPVKITGGIERQTPRQRLLKTVEQRSLVCVKREAFFTSEAALLCWLSQDDQVFMRWKFDFGSCHYCIWFSRNISSSVNSRSPL